MTELEFIARVLELKVEVTVSTTSDPQTTTRDLRTIELWKNEGKELLFHGIAPKQP